jgi:DSF synthase
MTLAATARPVLRDARSHFGSEITARATQQLIDIDFDQRESTIWAYLGRKTPPHVSRALLRELKHLAENIREGRYGSLRNRVISSRNTKAFSLGGDLALFIELIKACDHKQLFEYGKAAVDEIWANISGYGRDDLTTIALVNGEAQGGGFEAALSCHVLVAESETNFGFPESLFGMFPGMGGIPLLSARCDSGVASKILGTGSRYTAEFLHQIGVVDFLAPRGSGKQVIQGLIRDGIIFKRAQQRKETFAALAYRDLIDSVDEWVNCALRLNAKDLRSMGYLLTAQRRAYP